MKRLPGKSRRLWRVLAISPLCLFVLLWSADRLFPLPLPEDDQARVVLAEDGTPLWRFADAEGVWRYPGHARTGGAGVFAGAAQL